MSACSEFSPNVVVSHLVAWNGSRVAIRDDLLPGGTKQRACAPFLEDMVQKGFKYFIYASPFSGFAQVALAYVCHKLDLRCTIVCERDKRFEDKVFHPFSLVAQSYGAQLIMAEDLREAEQKAFDLSERSSLAYKIPLGFDCPEYLTHLEDQLRIQWSFLEDTVRFPIKTLWLPLGSGTLAKTFHKIVPMKTEIKCVDVHVLPGEDERITNLGRIDRISVYSAPMRFHEEAKDLPKIPSNIFYDAKIWNFINHEGQDQDIWWNVAQ